MKGCYIIIVLIVGFVDAFSQIQIDRVEVDNFQSSFPWCPTNLGVAEKDALMCTQERMFIADDVAKTEANRYSVRPCMPLVEVEDGGSFSSFDLAGLYIER